MEGQSLDAYFLCATPRTGSTLLCALLRSSGVAGRPESYFRAQDEALWARHWGLAPGFSFPDYLGAAQEAGRSPNGVFSARIMWGTMEALVRNTAAHDPGHGESDAQILERAFGRCRFVHLWREDAVAQAVSLLRAEQTGLWHTTDSAEAAGAAPPRYDFDQIRARVAEMGAHNAAWRRWFARNAITPQALSYEALDRDSAGEALKVLSFLGLSLPPGARLSSPTHRMADALSADWVARYRRDCAQGGLL